jgi:hypothetical protein
VQTEEQTASRVDRSARIVEKKKLEDLPDIRPSTCRIVDHPGIIARGKAARIHTMTVLVFEVVRLKLVCQDQRVWDRVQS